MRRLVRLLVRRDSLLVQLLVRRDSLLVRLLVRRDSLLAQLLVRRDSLLARLRQRISPLGRRVAVQAGFAVPAAGKRWRPFRPRLRSWRDEYCYCRYYRYFRCFPPQRCC
jgi:hypothetical protein